MRAMLDRLGRGASRVARPFRIALAGGLSVTVGLLAWRAQEPELARVPISIPNPSFSGYAEHRGEGVARIVAGTAPELLALDPIAPDGVATLLWLQGRTARPDGEGSVVLDDGGGIVRFDNRLRVRRIPLRRDGRSIVSIAPATEEGIWAADAAGELLSLDRDGVLRSVARAPFTSLALASDPETGRVWAARSPEQLSYQLPGDEEPLLVWFDAQGELGGTLGHARIPEHVLLAELANAGQVVTRDERLYYAPFVRDELIALSVAGDTLWVLERGLPQSIDEPRFTVENGAATIEYYPVNLGLQFGPDGLLYLLSTPDFTIAASRLDVIDPESGHLLRSGEMATATPTLAVDDRSRVYQLDPFRLLTGVAPNEREPLPRFDLPAPSGVDRAAARETTTRVDGMPASNRAGSSK